ncbi:MAG TPA: caspase family protein [Burkholderiaceae bacterium]|nr:caspase family protein [Burkholderiaceae bacterium]
MARALLLVLGLCTALLAADVAGAAEKRLALVIGNARYQQIPLNNPENDARVIAATLRRLGFEVIEHVNLNVRDFRRAVRQFARRVQDEDGVSVFYYAGHGVQIDGRNFLLPVDINLRDEEEIKDEAVDIDELYVSRLELARTQVRIVILDACRDNPFAGKTRSMRIAGGLAEMGARGALVAYSAGPGATAEDGPAGTNSVYTRHLAKEMLVEGVEIEQMLKTVRVRVMRDTNERQVPWVNTSLTANFSFNPHRGPSPAEASKQEAIARLQEMLEKRDHEQRRLEEELRRMSKKLEDAQRVGTVAAPAGPVLPSTPEAAADATEAAAAGTGAAKATPEAAKAAPAQAAPPATPPRPSPALAAVAPSTVTVPSVAIEPGAPRDAARGHRLTPAKIEEMTIGMERVPPPAPAPSQERPPAADVAALARPAPAATPGLGQSPSTQAGSKQPASKQPASTQSASTQSTTTQPASTQVAPNQPAPTQPPPTQAATDAGRPTATAALAPPKRQPAAAQKSAASAAGRAASERCVALLIRAQLGEPVPPADLAYLQKECRT